jgi:hypothetical protein
MNKKTLVLGASSNPERYAWKAVASLKNHGHEVEAVGAREGECAGEKIQIGRPELQKIDTVTLYLGAARQAEFENYIVKMKPRRVIFNPGAENPEFAEKLEKNGIETVEGCTLVMLSIGQY